VNKKEVIAFFEGDNAYVIYVYVSNMANFVDIGAWQYLQQYRHAYFDKMQVFLLICKTTSPVVFQRFTAVK